MNNYRDNVTGRYVKSPAARSLELTTELYRAFDFFNKRFADGELPKVVITIQESGRRNALGWFGDGFWRDTTTSDSVPEINLSAEYVSRKPEFVLETLLHEMAHLFNAVRGIRDCSSGQYHNKHFKAAAEEFGLKVERTGNKGWAFTSLGEEGHKAIIDFKPNQDVFRSLRRKSLKPIREKKYISLIIGAEYEDVLADAVAGSSLSQREFVERAVISACQQPVSEAIVCEASL
jgi:hypothetical protein